MVTIDGKQYPLESVITEKPVWEGTLNGQDITEQIETLTLINRDMGIGFLYGRSPAGAYNQGRLVNRGGAVIAPTVTINGTLYFLVLKQRRPLVGSDPIYEFPRGQALLDEDATVTAARELLEETGMDIPAENLVYLGKGNPDTALIHGANVHCWWLQIPTEFFTLNTGYPRLVGVFSNAESKLAENILHAEIVSEDEFESVSMMTSWAAGLVLKQIRRIEKAKA